jgi:hypothetical protein
MLTSIFSSLNSFYHHSLNPNESSIPAQPAPQTTNFGTIPFSINSLSFLSILFSKSLIGQVDKENLLTPGIELESLVLEPMFKHKTSYRIHSSFSRTKVFSLAKIYFTLP